MTRREAELLIADGNQASLPSPFSVNTTVVEETDPLGLAHPRCFGSAASATSGGGFCSSGIELPESAVVAARGVDDRLDFPSARALAYQRGRTHVPHAMSTQLRNAAARKKR
jgi:hypothetical protein